MAPDISLKYHNNDLAAFIRDPAGSNVEALFQG